MTTNATRRGRGEQGFTLIELLVVILIIGVLAAIAIPAFLGQSDKAQDATAKSAAAQAYKAARSYYVDNNGSYTGLSRAALTAVDPGLKDVNWSPDWCNGGTGVYGNGQTVCVAMRSKSSRSAQWEIREDVTYGPGITRACSIASSNGCSAAGRW